MRATPWLKSGFTAALAVAAWLSAQTGWAQASPFRGLWVGSAALDSVNEVTIPLDAANVPIAPDPEVPTPTFDRAELRILIHVNGAGQASLLKDVAILNRVHGQTTNGLTALASENDLALVTDPRLYSEYPVQPAMRYASATFDFGDAQATAALDTLVEQAARAAAAFATNAALDLATSGARVQARNDAVAQIQPQLEIIVAHADVAAEFSRFIQQFNVAALTAIIADPADPVVATLTTAAEAVRDRSFYGDLRALEMVAAVVAAVEAAPPSERYKAAHHAAAAYADVSNLYQRFISGSAVGDMISAAAVAAGTAAKLPGATAGSIEAALRAEPKTGTALTLALQAKVQAYDDTRSVAAVDAVLKAMAAAAAASAAQPALDVELQSGQAGRAALADMVARYPLPPMTPTGDYNAFVASSAYAATPAAAAHAAADAAIQERATNPLYTPFSLYAAAKVKTVQALQAAYGLAARAMRNELPLAGAFGPGSGDPRRIADLP